VPSFQLLHVSGEDLGVHRFAVPNWKVGDLIPLGGGTLRVVDVVWADDEEVAGVIVVEVAGV
jgi:hypothetical protein